MRRKMLPFGRLLLLAGMLAAMAAEYVYADTQTNEEELSLNARAAVLMDADSGRVLYGKDAEKVYPMASTTKVMTLIVALENADADSVATASDYAASMPEVRLGVRNGERYRLGDLYYALMLESFNDAAVMIAEEVAGSVEAFADLMNEKARNIGCTQTHFITPNGLDASDDEGVHATTARDLALIMRYAIGNEDFLEITQTRNYSFDDIEGKRHFFLNNKNALFDMLDGVLSGKTGYTGDAGYCYVCAVQVHDRCFIAALLGSGWPPHKNYKWQDVRDLISYGAMNYEYRDIRISQYADNERLHVTGGDQETAALAPEDKEIRLLLSEADTIRADMFLPGRLDAPVAAGTELGRITLRVGDFVVGESRYKVMDSVERKDFLFYLTKVFDIFRLP